VDKPIYIIAAIDAIVVFAMATTIQVNEKTKRELLKVASELQVKLGRKVDFDETIMALIEQIRDMADSRSRFEGLFASIKGDRVAWSELRKLRTGEKRRLERLARAA